MLQSNLFTKTLKENLKQEESLNSQLLLRAGFIDKTMAGVYTFLPLGLRTLRKIENIIREEMNNLGATEMLMPALSPKENWEQTGRLENIDVLFKVQGANEASRKSNKAEYILNSTHEELITPIAQKFALSYKDLPFATYQIQNKYRNEPRPKSGLLRGREFSMKDLYSFHESEEDMKQYYEKVKEAYLTIFKKLDLAKDTYITLASGGDFTTDFSHEFQTECENGEDEIYVCDECKMAINKEVLDRQKVCPKCGKPDLRVAIASEVGNTFPLNIKFSKAFNYYYTDKNGDKQIVYMASYGIGPSRVMGVLAEKFCDDKGVIWPESIAPFKVHLLSFYKNPEAKDLYNKLKENNIEVLFDDREEVSPGQKMAEADLIGCPWRVIISEKTLSENKVELKKRSDKDSELLSLEELIKKVHV